VKALHFIESHPLGYPLAGRIDQYLYPYYKADIEKGVLTPQEAQELIELLFIKWSSPLLLYGAEAAKTRPGYQAQPTFCLGGVDAEGRDASNELTYLFLEAAESLNITSDLVLLCHPRETPYALKMKAAELNGLGLAVPKLFNTEVIKAALMEQGFSAEEARVGWIQGCTEPYGPGCKQYGHSAASIINLPMALEAVLFNGRKRMPDQPMSGELVGVETGDPCQFSSFDDFMGALKIQIAQQIRDGHIAGSWVEWVQARHFPLMLQSLFTDACIERGLTAQAGGAKINVGPGIVPCGGLATTADSLAAIKKLVFEEKKISMEELLRAIDANFEGYETVRQMLINHAPKFGNDIDYVDNLAAEILRFTNNEAKSHITPLGNRNVLSTCRPMSNATEGARVWATPDGRKAGTPLSNHLGPTEGMDVNGPVAHINSMTKLELDGHWGAVHNMYFVNIDSKEKLHRMVHLIDLYFSRGGYHLQLNCQDKGVLIDAQKHPERYRGLMVRVAGYAAYFVDLPESIQDQIIGRTSMHV
jgi:formate C-acetyltransferase